jgi:hypothetical protein
VLTFATLSGPYVPRSLTFECPSASTFRVNGTPSTGTRSADLPLGFAP